ncbi:MAG TPA: hypothetical protein VML55_26045, partial [Planctomycetaceae bacterium]|nr:hypothetical protein [Planctomycetaceae bacterium]
MPEPLASRLGRLRSRIRQALCVYGVSWVVSVVFGAVLLAGLLDWAVHLDDAGVRFVLLLAILATGGWVAWRYLAAPLLRPFTDVDLAMRIERRFPGFNDGLTSTVEFLEGGTAPRFGSPELQRNVVDQTLRQVERIDFGDVIETRSVRRVAVVAMSVCLVVAAIVGFHQAEAATALNRLVFPFSAPPWPKKTELAFFTPEFEPLPRSLRLARGETLEVFVENVRGELPADLTMDYRFGEEEHVRERLRQTGRRDSQGRARPVAVATFVVEKGPVRFRAVGGDDDEMPWHSLFVVPPPVAERLHVTLTPPAYSGRAAEPLPEGVGHVQGLVGTNVEFRVVASKPLSSARLRVKNDPPQPLTLSDDGRRFEGAFTLREPGVYSWWLELTDREGFENPEAPRYEVRAIADQVPQVSIDDPASSMHVTPEAEIPLVVSARDDLGLREIRIQYRIDRLEGAGEYTARPLATPADRPQALTLEAAWPLAELKLVPGMSVVFHAEAIDEFDLADSGPEHVGKSTSRTLTVVTPEDKQAEVAARQGSLLAELDEVLKAQQQAHAQAGEVEQQLTIVGRLRPQD